MTYSPVAVRTKKIVFHMTAVLSLVYQIRSPMLRSGPAITGITWPSFEVHATGRGTTVYGLSANRLSKHCGNPNRPSTWPEPISATILVPGCAFKERETDWLIHSSQNT
ncbi:unnamed protein product [Chondrus crispus]|uniref:Uncharacterized protein n=1 Tax=Chondrus crispus TaxID=2769 RepID=R7Q3S7_CHOCR|nr:unnamed protein product [Chondrus crispus]CDF32140.1 unnamed protein product [Chondrus crispus]|eukprot:XP_005711805.1 unnamed protein product [Chondrus crispus]